MFLIYLSLIGFLAVAYLAEQAFVAVEKAEFVPVPVRVDEVQTREKKHFRH